MIPRTVRVFARDGWAFELSDRTRGFQAVFSGLRDMTDRRTYVGLDIAFGHSKAGDFNADFSADFSRPARAEVKVATGEYIYTLYNGGGIVAQGLATVGDYRPVRKEFDEHRKLIEYDG